MKLGIMGGTFDPPHMAHLVIAEMARTGLQLDKIIFIPAGDPWMKSVYTVTCAKKRVEMVGRAIDSNPSFSLSLIEVDRPGPTYTVDTIEQLAGEIGQNSEMFLLLGWDSVAELPYWKAPYRLSKMVRIVAFPRPGAVKPDPKEMEKAMPGSAERIIHMDQPYLSISSTCIRQRVKEGKSVRYLVPEGVALYIVEHKLYTA
ncbi:MAG: nicotinate-nucleotide adenylyltransferase [Dehalococcoidia bacterium]|nr:nicotinate-nucleotide adenylyltransferase [Dehalococcoidia bacterium]